MEERATAYQNFKKIKANGGKWLRDNLMYVIVFLASLAILVFVPMLGSDFGSWGFKDFTSRDWMYYIGIRLIVATLNTSIFIAFNVQGEINSKENSNYIEAKRILQSLRQAKEIVPRSPHEWKRKTYLSKGTAIALATAFTLLIFTNPHITYDKAMMLTYILTIIIAIIGGILQMGVAEDYWTNEFLEYAIYAHKQHTEQQQHLAEYRAANTPAPAPAPAPASTISAEDVVKALLLQLNGGNSNDQN